MATSIVDPETLLAIDIGSIHTRAALFDVVEGRYEVVALGVAPTTAQAPWKDVREGVVQAVEQVQRMTGRPLLGGGGELLTASTSEQEGAPDQVVLTLSAGKPLKVICIGALQSISLDSVRRLAESTYTQVVQVFHLNDRLTPEARLNKMVQAHPDLILLAGGTDGGAAQSVLSMVENVGLAVYLLPAQRKPLVLYAGNEKLVPKVRELLEPLAGLWVAPNVRPSLDTERLLVGHHELVSAFRRLRLSQMHGLDDLVETAQGRLLPTATAFGRMIRYLSQLYGGEKGVLGVDLGASATTLAAAWKGQMTLKVFPFLGVGERLETLLSHTSLSSITRWLTVDIDENDVVDYLYTKAAFPDSVPMTEDELQVEQALARQLLRLAVKRAYPDFPKSAWQPRQALPFFEPIVLSGSLFSGAPHPAHAVLVALDGLQPIGVTTLVLDQSHLLPMLGAAAEVNPYLSVQVLESPHFMPLATVISPVWRGGFGRPILRVKVEREGKAEAQEVEVRSGALEVIPIPLGTQARVTLRPLGGTDVGRGPGRGYSFQVAGTHLGLVLDGRGRPLRLPADRERRYQLYRLWWSKIQG